MTDTTSGEPSGSAGRVPDPAERPSRGTWSAVRAGRGRPGRAARGVVPGRTRAHRAARGSGASRGRRGQPPAKATIDISGAPARGSDRAIVTLVEFSDYECPFCIRHFPQTMPKIEAAYIDTGKIRYVFRDFPIDSNHPAAIKAHEAARCADEQHRFWALHPRLFSPPGTHTPADLEARASEAHLDLAAFRDCLASGRTTAAVRATEAIAVRLGADGTPAFYLGAAGPGRHHRARAAGHHRGAAVRGVRAGDRRRARTGAAGLSPGISATDPRAPSESRTPRRRPAPR